MTAERLRGPLTFVFKDGDPRGVRFGTFFWALGQNHGGRLPAELPWPGFADCLPRKLSVRLFDLWFLASRPRAAGGDPGVLVAELLMLPSWNTREAHGDSVSNALAWIRNRASDSVLVVEDEAGPLVVAAFADGSVDYQPAGAERAYARALAIAIGRAVPPERDPWLQEVATWPRLFGVDELRTAPDFMGRNAELALLRERLLTPLVASPPPVLVTGTSGIGKTQLVAAFLMEHAARFEHVLFVHAHGADLTAAIGRWASQLDGSIPFAATPARRAERVREVLERSGPSLLVLDDVSDARAAAAWLPRRGPCRIIMTSRLPLIDGAQPITLAPLSRVEAEALLTWHLPPEPIPDDADLGAIADICDYFGGSPFALHVAGVHMAAAGLRPSELRAMIREAGPAVISVDGMDMAGYPRNVDQVFGLAYERMAVAVPAPRILENALVHVLAWICGLLAAAPAPRRLLAAAMVSLAPYEAAATQIDAAIEVMQGQSLVQCDSGEIYVHALPGRYFESRIPTALRPAIVEAYLAALVDTLSRHPTEPALLPHAARARELVTELPATPRRHDLEVELLTWEAAALMQMHGYAAPDTAAVFQRSAELAQVMTPTPGLFALEFMRWVPALIEARLGDAFEQAQRLVELATALAIPAMEAAALQAIGAVLSFQGRNPEAIAVLERGIVLADSTPSAREDTRQAQDPRVTSRCDLARAYLMTGRPDSALRLLDDALTIGGGHPFSHAFALFSLTMAHQYRREPAKAHERAQQLVAVCGRFGFRQFDWMGRIFLGWSIASLGHYEAGVEVTELAMARVTELNAFIARVADTTLLAELHLVAGNDAACRAALDRSRDLVERTGEAYYAPERYRVEACLALRTGGDAAEAERSLLAGLELARHQAARWHELRLLTELGRVRRAHADLSTADELAVCLDAVGEGRQLPTYREALTELAAHRDALSPP